MTLDEPLFPLHSHALEREEGMPDRDAAEPSSPESHRSLRSLLATPQAAQ